MNLQIFLVYFPLLISIILQVFSIYLLSNGSIFLTYHGYDVTEQWALIFIFALFVNLTRVLLVREGVLDLFKRNAVTNFFAAKFFPKLSFAVSFFTLFLFSGFRKLIFLQNRLLDSTTFWGNTMIHKRYDYQTRAEYFDKLVFERKIYVDFDERAAILDTSNTMSDIFDSVLGLQKQYFQGIESAESLVMCLAIICSFVAVTLFLKWFFGSSDEGDDNLGSSLKEINSKHLNLDERVSKIETLLNSLGDEVKGSLTSGYAMSIDHDPEQFGRVLGAIICGFKNSMDKHDSLIVRTFKQLYGVDYEPKVPTESFPGKGNVVGGELKNPYKGNLLDNLDE